MQVSVHSTFSFTCRSPYDLAPLRTRGEVSRVGAGQYVADSGNFATTNAVRHEAASHQGSVTIPAWP